jgi:hypothetical protein
MLRVGALDCFVAPLLATTGWDMKMAPIKGTILHLVAGPCFTLFLILM